MMTSYYQTMFCQRKTKDGSYPGNFKREYGWDDVDRSYEYEVLFSKLLSKPRRRDLLFCLSDIIGSEVKYTDRFMYLPIKLPDEITTKKFINGITVKIIFVRKLMTYDEMVEGFNELNRINRELADEQAAKDAAEEAAFFEAEAHYTVRKETGA